MENELPPRIGNFGQTGTLGNLIDRPLPALVDLVQGLPRGVFEVMLGHPKLYGLTRDQLRYILDPADVKGPDYPSETFRVLKKNEIARFGEYRTARLVLQAWDAMEKK